MNITEVITRAKTYSPSEYDESEMRAWCDEVSQMLAVEVLDTESAPRSDETLCGPPYDSMYIDYVLAKICLYQRDFDTYNQFMASFNSKLDAYKRWYMSGPPRRADKLKNWW